MKALAKDRFTTQKCDLRNNLCKRLVSQVSRMLHLYPFPDFYSNDYCYALFDTRITAWQQESVKSILLTQDRLFQTRKEKAERIFELLQPVSCVGTFPVYSCFVDDIPIMEEQLRPLGIKTRRVWPAFQSYTETQMTENVRYLKEHLLLLDTDSLTMENMESLRGLRHHAL
jgi:putative perosamine synthetase